MAQDLQTHKTIYIEPVNSVFLGDCFFEAYATAFGALYREADICIYNRLFLIEDGPGTITIKKNNLYERKTLEKACGLLSNSFNSSDIVSDTIRAICLQEEEHIFLSREKEKTLFLSEIKKAFIGVWCLVTI